jgi:hypothetical protein
MMGKINIFLVVLVVIVVGANFSNLNKNSENLSEAMNRYHQTFKEKSMGSFAMNYGIYKLESGEVLLENESVTWIADDYEVMSSNIDSIQYIPGVGDTVKIVPYISGNYVGNETNRVSSATLGFNIIQPEEQFAYYMFDDGTGGVLSDSSSYVYDGTLVNMDDTDWLDGVDNYALDFDGDDDYVYLGEEIAQSYDDMLTLATWITMDSGNHGEWGSILRENSDFDGNQSTGFTLEMKVTFIESGNGNGNGGNGNHWGWGWGNGNQGNHWGWGNDTSGDEYIDFHFEIVTSSGLEDVDLRVYDWEIDILAWHYLAVVVNTEDQTIRMGIVDEDIWAEESICGTSLPARDLISNITLGSIFDPAAAGGNNSGGNHYGWGQGTGDPFGWEGNAGGNGHGWAWAWAWGWGHGNSQGNGACPVSYSGFDGTIDALRFIADAMTVQELRQLMLYHGVMKPTLHEWKI